MEPHCKEMITNNQFFELHHLHKVDDLQFTQQCIVTEGKEGEEGCVLTISLASAFQTKQPKSCPEFYTLLYMFGQYYLQFFPGKTAAFLEYLSFLTKYMSNYHMTVLLKLDKSIRWFFIQHPVLNWHVTHPEIDRFIKDTDIKQSKLNNANTKAKSKAAATAQPSTPRPSNCGGQGNSGSASHRDGRYDNQCSCHYNAYDGNGRSYNQSTEFDLREHHCRNWNFNFALMIPSVSGIMFAMSVVIPITKQKTDLIIIETIKSNRRVKIISKKGVWSFISLYSHNYCTNIISDKLVLSDLGYSSLFNWRLYIYLFIFQYT